MDWSEQPEPQTVVDRMIDDLVKLKTRSKSSHEYMVGCLDKLSEWLSSEGYKNHLILFRTIKNSFQKMMDSEKGSLEDKSRISILEEKLEQAKQKYRTLDTESKKQIEEINRLKQALGFLQGGQKMSIPPSMPKMMAPLFSPPHVDAKAAEKDIGSDLLSNDLSAILSSDSTSSKGRYPQESQSSISSNKPMRSTSPVPGFGQPSNKKSASTQNPFEDIEDSGIEMMTKHDLWEMFGYALRWATEKNWKREPIIGIKKVENLYCVCCRSKRTFYYHSNPNKSLRVMACYGCGNGVSKQVDDDSMDVDQFYKDFVVEVLEAKTNKSRNTSRKPARR